jgi:hypothetical protein
MQRLERRHPILRRSGHSNSESYPVNKFTYPVNHAQSAILESSNSRIDARVGLRLLDTLLGRVRAVRELERLTLERATPDTVVSDNGTELTSGADSEHVWLEMKSAARCA